MIDVGDGGFVALDHYRNSSVLKCIRLIHSKFDPRGPIMIIVHGVVGGSHSHYVRHYVKILESNGIASVVMNARGCSGSILKVR